MEKNRMSPVELQMKALGVPIRQAMVKDPGLLHRAFSLEARIAIAEILGKSNELGRLLTAYHILSSEATQAIQNMHELETVIGRGS